MKRLIYIAFFILLFWPAYSQEEKTKVDYDSKMEWWRDAKFGMFIHWGPYATYGGIYNGYHQRKGGTEWIMNRCKVPVMEYKARATTFNPIYFNAEDIVLAAKNAGMKYIVFTSKHHDGFAMFKSEASNFNIVDYTPFKRDVVDELYKACHKYGIKLGLYYSQSQDWTHPGGAEARRLMSDGWANPDSTMIDAYTEEHNGSWDPIQTSQSADEYYHKVAIPQIKELLQRYNDLAVLWFDTPERISEGIAKEIHEIVEEYPNLITNDRLRKPDFPGDYKTPEGFIPKPEDVKGVDWETCMTIGSSWGYKSWETDWKSSRTIIQNLVKIAARGGNYLLNVGPDDKGVIPDPELDRLKEVGKWMSVNGESIYGTRRSNLSPSWGECTRKDGAKNTTFYLCVFDWPKDGKLTFETKCSVKSASLLADGKKLQFSKSKDGIVISVPNEAPDDYASVIKIELRKKLPPERLISNTDKYNEQMEGKNAK